MFVKMGYSVKFLGDNFLHEEPYSTTLQQMGVEILYGPEYQAGIWDWLTKNKDEIDFAYLNRPHIAIKYVDFIKKNTNIKVIYYGHDLHFLREYREYELTGDIKKKRESDYWKSIEFSLMEKAAVSYYPSYVEEEAIHAIHPEYKIKAITAYVYEKFLENIDKDFAKRLNSREAASLSKALSRRKSLRLFIPHPASLWFRCATAPELRARSSRQSTMELPSSPHPSVPRESRRRIAS